MKTIIRQFGLLTLALVLTGVSAQAAPGGWDRVDKAKPKQVLFFTKSSGFEHSVVKRTAPDQLSHAEKLMTEWGVTNGFSVTCTKDGGVFTAANLAKYDVICFYTSGMLTDIGTDKQPAIPVAGKQLLLEAIRNGKGFVGLHPSTDCFHHQPEPADRSTRYQAYGADSDPYTAMIGGEFIRHGAQQKARVTTADAAFPGCEHLKGGFELHEEWYTLKDFALDMHALLILETKGMKGIDYQRAPFPISWARPHGKGRVFYTAMGHREDVWTNPLFINHVVGGLGWAAGNVGAEVTPNLEQVAPGFREIQPQEPKKPAAPAAPAAK
jgi:type 1 glutamine amidotransferase